MNGSTMRTVGTHRYRLIRRGSDRDASEVGRRSGSEWTGDWTDLDLLGADEANSGVEASLEEVSAFSNSRPGGLQRTAHLS